MQVLGIDLAGPANIDNTCVARFRLTGSGLSFVNDPCEGSDGAILSLVERLARHDPVVVGLDAPLSYQPGGGDRVRDSALRHAIIEVGMHSGSVMAPTATRMVYLTLRGVTLAAHLRAVIHHHPVDIVEVHPGAAMGLRRAPLDLVTTYKDSPQARLKLLDWLRSAGLANLEGIDDCSSHFVSACAAALAAWHWRQGSGVWMRSAEKPWHPYDFSC